LTAAGLNFEYIYVIVTMSAAEHKRDSLATLEYRQTLGLLVSEHWVGGYDDADAFGEGTQLSPVKIVARHLRQAKNRSNRNAKTVDLRSSLVNSAETHQSPHLHPGFVPSSKLSTNNPSQATNTSGQEDIYYPTCDICFGPLQPGAFGSSTRIVSAMEQKSLQRMSSAQKRRLRRKRRKVQTERALRHQQQKKASTTSKEWAKWYEHAYELQEEATRPGINTKQHVTVTCGICQSECDFPIPAPNKKGHLSKPQDGKKKPAFLLSSQPPSTNAAPKGRRNAPSKDTMEGDFISFDNNSSKKPRKRPAVVTDIASALKPKKTRKKKGKKNPLMDFLSSLNDH